MLNTQVNHELLARRYGEDQALSDQDLAGQDHTDATRTGRGFHQAEDAELLRRLKAFRGKLAADFKFDRDAAHGRGQPQNRLSPAHCLPEA